MIKSSFTRTTDIDSMIDMLVEVQKENGITPTMTEALFDPNTKEKINVFKRKRLEEKGVDLTPYGFNPACNSCKNKKKEDVSDIERGVFVYDANDMYVEVDGEYICEYCTKIGYDSAYRPDMCDTCNDCEECTEYMSNECDGCKYSTLYNDGASYGEATGEEGEINMEDSLLFEEVVEGRPNYDKERPTGKFTIMDY
jgi:hypothetical protein